MWSVAAGMGSPGCVGYASPRDRKPHPQSPQRVSLPPHPGTNRKAVMPNARPPITCCIQPTMHSLGGKSGSRRHRLLTKASIVSSKTTRALCPLVALFSGTALLMYIARTLSVVPCRVSIR
ncbi:hypothetical protein SVAN01_08150 [Stagonosporopsis vannaccii]|nr:hypothetical protein SVAN01_08150 [Stagonosporopsis vannaccii]